MQFNKEDELLGEMTVYSVGGGAILIEGEECGEGQDVYPHHSLKEIQEYCFAKEMELWEYVDAFDPMDDYIEKIMEQMMATVEKWFI